MAGHVGVLRRARRGTGCAGLPFSVGDRLLPAGTLQNTNPPGGYGEGGGLGEGVSRSVSKVQFLVLYDQQELITEDTTVGL